MSDHPQLKEMKKKIRTEAKALAASREFDSYKL